MTWTAPLIPNPRKLARQRGVALIVVLWVAILLALIAGGVTRLSRGDLNVARNLVESTKAELAADSALRTALYTILNQGPEAWPADGRIYAWRFGEAEVRVRVTAEQGRIDINAAAPDLLAALFTAAGVAPEDASVLADEVVAFRDRVVQEAVEARVGDEAVDLTPPFTLTDGLEQVDGMPPGLVGRIADAVTVYTGEGQPRVGVSSPLVLAALEGRELTGAEAAGQAVLPEDEAPELGDSPAALTPATDEPPVQSAILRIEAEARSAGGSYFAREAVVTLERRRAMSYRLRLWRRGSRTLFPAAAHDG